MTLWLTRITPNLRHQRSRADLHNAVGMHRTVMSLFPDQPSDQPRRHAGVLFRLDNDAAGPQILVQSQIEPAPENLVEDYGTHECREITPLIEQLRPGVVVHYRIVACSSKRLARDQPPYRKGQRIARTEAEALAWWELRAPEHGLTLNQTQTTMITAERSARSQDTIRHPRTRFQGIATITDAEIARQAVLRGIGRGKAYGCGLLSLAPVRSPW
ncbi:type I-E CRISPR-associated protein Cas6/Cse3/CasE [Crossiella sp. SN42]|uniref:type I-E CRISPR-associated protein Cas6/Cse3/CasE n=1 Tax=Crossiella sp. SN42 TaxID=2944808 RepID=UPI00207CF9AF|nr:type I-E CRISPR-associated protein Cas6/Cse3/CasE [Crossiella sp. SN42]MCO1575838.1 type I-E CRISPR-associated protein Cas6/Cse3/CasE [Crossiella sp. SN42]